MSIWRILTIFAAPSLKQVKEFCSAAVCGNIQRLTKEKKCSGDLSKRFGVPAETWIAVSPLSQKSLAWSFACNEPRKLCKSAIHTSHTHFGDKGSFHRLCKLASSISVIVVSNMIYLLCRAFPNPKPSSSPLSHWEWVRSRKKKEVLQSE